MSKVINLRRKRRNNFKQKYNKSISIKNFSKIKEDRYKIFLVFISVVGILLGAIAYRITDNSQIIKLLSDSICLLNSGNFKSIILYFIKLDALLYIISFFIGTSFIGSALTFIVPMLKCLYIGYFSGYLYNEFELKGVLFCLILLFPCFVITTTSLIFASNENIYMSKYIFECINERKSTDNISIRLYLLRYILLITINVACIIVTSLAFSFIAPKISII